jgi:hypothetical protein
MILNALAVLFAIGAAACTAQQPATYRELERLARDHEREAISRPPPDSCQMAAHQNLIGLDGASIDRATLPPHARVICHDCVVTMDFNAQRLNVHLARDGKVERLSCG